MTVLRKSRLWVVIALGGAIGWFTVAAALFNGTPATETFDGSPASPLAFSDVDWDVQIHSRDPDSWFSLPPINAQHGDDCSAPPATHVNTSYEGSVFQCRDHIMTSINGAAGYALIVLTPNRLLDFSGGGTVTFDLSTERMSARDWWDVSVSPFADAQALPLLSDLSQGVDLQDPNRNSVVIATDNGEGAPNLKVMRNGSRTDYGPPGWAGTPFNAGITAGTNQSATRQPFKLTISPTHVRFERLASATGTAVVFIDQDIPALTFTSGVIQLGHHSYTPEKDGAGVPATWHWDSVSVSPSTPFTILKADQRVLFDDGLVTFPAAPAGAKLRFSAICRPVVNGAAAVKLTDTGHYEHVSSYAVPIPAGSTSATLAFVDDGWYPGPCHAKDFHVWSLDTGGAPSATPTTAAPTNTPTPVPSTATPTPTVVAPTATATSTPTPVPATPCRIQTGNGNTWTRGTLQPFGTGKVCVVP